jgi:microtubule-associated protein-like 5
VDRNAAAAVFVRFGFDKNGLLPYEVFIQGLNETPARLLGHELLLNKTLSGKSGIEDLTDVAFLVRDAKVKYAKASSSVFPCSGFDERLALRSMALPRAHMYLEHVYGYAGSNIANNLYFTHNTAGQLNEVVFYAGMLGVVATWIDGDTEFGTRQRFFFGHDNDVLCLTMHPNRRFVATGQQTSTAGVPYACVWDIGEYGADDATRLATGDPARMREIGVAREPVQLQRLEVAKEYRCILAVAFSGDAGADSGGREGPDERGGELLITLCGDDHHTVHVWRWMVPAEMVKSANKKLVYSHCKAMYIPCWHYGPEKKLADLHASYKFYCNSEDGGPQRFVPGAYSHPCVRTQWLVHTPCAVLVSLPQSGHSSAQLSR